MIQVKFKKLSEKAITPSYARNGDAGLDISCITYKVDKDFNYIEYFTGLAFEIPEGHVGLLFPRSSVSKTDLRLANGVGVIDSGYRGEVVFRYKFKKDAYFAGMKRYVDGDRVGQLIIIPIPQIELEEVSELTDTDRGAGGFGSTGN